MVSRRGPGSLAACLLAALFAACSPRAEVSVQVLTDLVPQVDFDRIVLVRDGAEIVGRNVSSTQRFDTPYILAELTDVAPGTTVRLRVELQRGGGSVIDRTIETRIDASRVLLFVLSSACRSVSCPPTDRPSATECENGECVEPVCQGAACSPDADIDERDAAIVELDAGTPDDAAQGPDAASELDAAVDPDAFVPIDAFAARDAYAAHDSFTPLDAYAAADAYVPRDAFVPRDAYAAADARDAFVPRDAYAPPDAWGICSELAVGSVCRASRGPCDPEERCLAGSAGCPTDVISPLGTVCRGRGRDRPCDAIEVCDGRSPLCPADANERNGTTCNQYCGSETCMDGVCSGGVSCNPTTHSCCEDACMPIPCRAS